MATNDKPKEKTEHSSKKGEKEFMTIFVNGKQKRVKRPRTIEGMDEDEFIRRNADPIWLVQNQMWEYLDTNEDEGYKEKLNEYNT